MVVGHLVLSQAPGQGVEIVGCWHEDGDLTQADARRTRSRARALPGVDGHVVVVAAGGGEQGAVHLGGELEAQGVEVEGAGALDVDPTVAPGPLLAGAVPVQLDAVALEVGEEGQGDQVVRGSDVARGAVARGGSDRRGQGGAVGVDSVAVIGIASALASLAIAVGAFSFRWVARHGVARLIPVVFALSAVGLVVMWASSTPTVATVGGAITSLGAGLMFPTLLIWSLSGLTYEQRGRGAGRFTASIFLGQFASPLVVAALAAAAGGERQDGLDDPAAGGRGRRVVDGLERELLDEPIIGRRPWAWRSTRRG